MCLLSDAELNCVRTKMRRMSACRQLLIGMSIRRYFPPIGTAGFERCCVSGNRRVPCPPPRTIARTSLVTVTNLLQSSGFGHFQGEGLCWSDKKERRVAFRLIPREEKFYNDFQALADELQRGAQLLEQMLAP